MGSRFDSWWVNEPNAECRILNAEFRILNSAICIRNAEVAELVDLPAACLPVGRAGRRAGQGVPRFEVVRVLPEQSDEKLYLCWFNEQPPTAH